MYSRPECTVFIMPTHQSIHRNLRHRILRKPESCDHYFFNYVVLFPSIVLNDKLQLCPATYLGIVLAHL